MAESSKWPSYAQPVSTYATTGEKIRQRKAPIMSGGGGGGPTVDAETRRYVDKSMETVKAQNDARFSEVLGRLDGLKAQIDHAPVPLSFTQFLAGAAAVLGVGLALVFAVLAFASDRFDGGLGADAIKDQIAAEQLVRDKAQDAKLDQILESVLVLGTDKKLKP